MNYILEEIPDYKKAEDNLNKKIGAWTRSLSELKGEIQQLKSDLSQEKPLLTEVLIEQKEDEILLKELEYKNIELAYFGPRGALFRLRAQLVAPIQDNIYNSIQEIAKKGNYDLVIDKSSELILLYSNKKYDISDFVLNEIVRERKIKINEEKRQKKSVLSKEKTEKQKKLLRDREALRKKKDEERKARQKKSEEIRKKRIADIAEKKRILKEKKEAIKKKNNLEQGNN